MREVSPIPPPISPPATAASRFRSWWPVVGVVGLTALVWAARLAERASIPLPLCSFRALTGIPCPFCGSTRAVQAAAHGDWRAALTLNPLLSAVVAGLAVACVARVGDACLRSAWTPALLRRLRYGLDHPKLLALALLLNWLYLCLTLPR